MNAAHMQRTDLLPPNSDGLGSGLLLAAVVHVALVVALSFSVNWHASEPEGVTAELWAAVPQVAAPRAADPPAPQPAPQHPTPMLKAKPVAPPAHDAQIAIEKNKREKEKAKEKEKERIELDEKKRLQEEKLKASKAEADRLKKEEARTDTLLATQREANIRRILGEAGATGNNPGKASTTAGPSAAYGGRIKARVKPNILLTDTIEGNPVAEVEVRCAPDGTIMARKLIKSSGVKEWDEAVLRALDKTEILPRDVDGSMPSPMVIAFKPRDF